MAVLVVHGYRVPDGYNAALHATAARARERAGHAVTTIDLYRDDFDSRLCEAERRGYRDSARPLPEDVRRSVDALHSHDALLFVFPTWCFGMPAILKGWLDRVLRPGVAFDIDGTVVTLRLFDIDMRRCPRCGDVRVKIIGAILERAVIGKILAHLGLDPRPPPRSKAREAGLEVAV